MEGELLMEHPALLGEGFQLGKAQLLRLALLMERVDLLHDVLRGGVAGNGQGLHQRLMRSSVSACFSRSSASSAS